jgi:hypothetical protein
MVRKRLRKLGIRFAFREANIQSQGMNGIDSSRLLVRRYRGKDVVVRVRGDGFEYDGQRPPFPPYD